MRTRLRTTRKAKQVTLEFLAERLGISRAQMSRIETGQRKLTVEMLGQIAEILGVNTGDLIEFPLLGEDLDMLVGIFQGLDDDKQEMILQMMRSLDAQST